MLSCKTPPQVETIYIPEEMKPYIMFPVGSYWVYEDSATLQTDSFYLKEILIDTVQSPDGQTDGFTTSLYERLIQYFKDESEDIFISFTSFKYNDFLYYQHFFGAVFKHDIPLNNFLIIEGDSLIHVLNYDTLTLLEETYSNVLVLDYSDIYRTYWSKNIGMIRYERYKFRLEPFSSYTDTLIIYNLKKYHIND